ncbi:DUF6163 family protein [Methylocystis bryophila]|uniref:Uncharacterized protein n=1 Tax=Methylocystis bryophila TaxID=655015 RepID=A0A1W6MSF6_9HYPH|nr:DUF6163 family protein [Methylocystis bryophila]ARN80419.1 hypothetical protein B1812_04265 [Methylocystis bryophila]BDV40427.1 hypothetical protein DSM21852_36800 [Methylocystis bryophila]
MADFSNGDDSDDPYRAIRIGEPGAAGEATKWGLLLTRFMRLIAAFWLIQGLAQWRVVLMSPQSIFDAMPQPAAVAVVFFGVADLVAGVGLWLATPWGGVLWLLIASAQIFVAAGMPNFFSGGYYLIAVDLVLIMLYFILTFEAGRDFEAKKVLDQRQRRRASILRQTGAPPPETLGATLMRHLEAIPFIGPRPSAKKAAPPPSPSEPIKPRPASAPLPSATRANGAPAPKEPARTPMDTGDKRLAHAPDQAALERKRSSAKNGIGSKELERAAGEPPVRAFSQRAPQQSTKPVDPNAVARQGVTKPSAPAKSGSPSKGEGS